MYYHARIISKVIPPRDDNFCHNALGIERAKKDSTRRKLDGSTFRAFDSHPEIKITGVTQNLCYGCANGTGSHPDQNLK